MFVLKNAERKTEMALLLARRNVVHICMREEQGGNFTRQIDER